MAVQRYLDFDLCIEKTAAGYHAQVLQSPAGEATLEFNLPFSPFELENFVLKVGGRRRVVRGVAAPELDAAREFGGRLFQAVFDNEVRGCLHSSVLAAEQQGAGLRIRLRLDDAPELADLPWEFLYNPDRGLFLSLSAKTPVVRYIEVSEPTPSLRVAPPLRMLVIVSSPSDYEPLDVEHEWANLTSALAPLIDKGALVVERMELATLPELQRTLRARPINMLHFIGHGTFDERSGDGALIFEDAAGKGAEVSGQYLGTLLHDTDALRLVVLNACEGARSSATDPFAGAAQSLVRQGLPAVIAMQFEVSDAAAITFAREFYGAVADSYPIDAALAEVRKALYAQSTGVEWGTPVLYLRADSGQIFDVAPAAPAAAELFGLPQPPASTAPTASVVEAVVAPTEPGALAGAPPVEHGPLMRLVLSGGNRLLTIVGGVAIFAAALIAVLLYFFPGTISCRVVAPALNLRSGPGTSFVPPVRALANGTVLAASGRIADSSWLNVRTEDGYTGWVGSRPEVLACDGDITTLAVVAAPPAPTAVAATEAASPVANASASAEAKVPATTPDPTATPAPDASPPAETPTATLPPAPSDIVLAAALPRSVRFSSLVYTVSDAVISTKPPSAPGFTPPAEGAPAYATLVVSIFNPLPSKLVAIGLGQIRLQLGNGQTLSDLQHWSGTVDPETSIALRLVYAVPAGTTWDGAKLLVRGAGKEPALLALDGPVPDPQGPIALAPGGSVTAGMVVYRILTATLDRDDDGERAAVGERFARLQLRVVNNDTAVGGVLVAGNNFRLMVEDVPLAPINSPGVAVPPKSAKLVDVLFTVPAAATTATLQVGELAGPNATIPLNLDPTLPTPTPAPALAPCSGPIGERFAALYSENVGARVPLGCATEAARSENAVEQLFEHGRMLWIAETDTIYALLDPDGGTYQVFGPAATAALPAAPEPERPESPVRGFGRVYYGVPEIRAALGEPRTLELGFTGERQAFRSGALFFVPAHDGQTETRFMVLNDGTFTRYGAGR